MKKALITDITGQDIGYLAKLLLEINYTVYINVCYYEFSQILNMVYGEKKI